MEIKDILFLGFKNFKGRKKILNIIITTILFLIVIISLTIANSVNNTIYNVINKDLTSRTFEVSGTHGNNEEIANYLSNINHVIKVIDHNQYAVSSLKISNVDDIGDVDWTINAYGADNIVGPIIVKGRGFSDNETNVAICSNNFSVDGNSNDISSKMYIDGNNLLNKNITITYDEYDYDYSNNKLKQTLIANHKEIFKVIGLYSSQTLVLDNTCYINFKDVGRINAIETNNNYQDEKLHNSIQFPVIFIDNYKNLTNVKKIIENLNNEKEYKLTLRSLIEIDNDEVNSIIKIIYIIILSVIIIFIVCTSIFFIKSIIKRKPEIGLYKSIGYKNNEILKVLITEQLLILSISFIIASLVFQILHLIYYYISHNIYFMLLKIPFSYPLFYSISAFILFIFITILVFNFLINKIAKINPSIIMKK